MRRLLILVLATCGAISAAAQGVNTPVNPTPLDHSEPGVYRCTFEAVPAIGMVMVLRVTESRGDYVYDKSDMVEYSSGDRIKVPIVVRDPSESTTSSTDKPERTGVKFEAGSGDGELTGMRVRSANLNNNVLTFDFIGENRKPVRFVYEGFIETYASAKARIPKLREMPKPGDMITGWHCIADIREHKKR